MDTRLSLPFPCPRRAIAFGVALSLLLSSVAATTVASSDPGRPVRGVAARSAGAGGVDGIDGVRDRIALGMTMPGGALATLDDFSASIGGQRPNLWSISVKWGSDSGRDFPNARAEGLAKRGVVPFVWWTPTDPETQDDAAFSYKRIVAGDHDTYIRRFARDAKAYGRLVLLRFAHEFNGQFFRWAVEGPIGHEVEDFKEAWRHIWRVFDQEGASNVRFVWSVVKRRCPGGCNPYREYYPGDRFVDYLGFSSYNWGLQQGRWTGMAQTYRRVVQHLSAISDKPMIAAETGSGPDGGDKAAWIAEGYREVIRDFPRIVAIVYTNVDLRNIGHPDWSLTSPNGALDAYATISAMRAFSGRLELAGVRTRQAARHTSRLTRKAAAEATRRSTDRDGATARRSRVHAGEDRSDQTRPGPVAKRKATTTRKSSDDAKQVGTLDTLARTAGTTEEPA
jgi:hypothetical protein